MRSKVIAAGIVVLLIFAGTAGYLNSTAPVKIGFLSTLSGRYSEIGVNSRNALLLEVENINAGGGINGRKIDLIIQDDLGTQEGSAYGVKVLRDKGVRIVIGPSLSFLIRQVLQDNRDQNMLFISPTISGDFVTGLDDNFIRVIPSATFQGEALAEEMIKSGQKTAALIYDRTNSDYTVTVAGAFIKKFTQLGGSVIYRNDIVTGGPELKTCAANIVKHAPSAAVFVTVGVDAAQMAQLAVNKGYKGSFYGSTWVKTSRVIEFGGRAVEGMKFVTPFERKDETKQCAVFKAQLKKRYNAPLNFAAAYAFDSLLLVTEAIKNGSGMNAMEVKKKILSAKKYSGIQDDFEIDAFGDAKREVMIEVIRDGKYERKE